MEGPPGASAPAECIEAAGCILLVDPERRLVWTDALTAGFRPSGGGFMTADIMLTPDGSGTLYRVRALHKD